jgi:two-component system, chemotaxis family, protein-glutamate methylesterase/glutaminase
MTGHDIVVIGGSSGGIDAVLSLVAQLPTDLPAALFVVMHTAPDGPGFLPQILNRVTSLNARTANDPDDIKQGTIYVPPPDHHLLVKDGIVRTIRGPRENRMRPAIDPLFRTAAVAYSTRVIGIILSGYLDDGASGLLAIKRCGGIAIVQDPSDAEVPDMPRNALEKAPVDYVVPIKEMGALLSDLVRSTSPQAVPIPDDIRLEARIAETGISTIDMTEQLGPLTPLSCPECGGPLWHIEEDEVRRYRCHVGHGYTAQFLLNAQKHDLEQALWEAVRSMEQQVKLLESLASDERRAGRERTAVMYDSRARESKQHAEVIRRHLIDKDALLDSL